MSSETLTACVIIPAYNAEATIGAMVGRAKATGLDIVVVSDGSTDRTAGRAIEAGAVIIGSLHHEGMEAALRLGFAYALERGYAAVVTMDGDGRHDPADVPALLAAARRTPDTLVIRTSAAGNRRGPLMRWMDGLTSRLLSWITRRWAPDPQRGFRVIRLQAAA